MPTRGWGRAMPVSGGIRQGEVELNCQSGEELPDLLFGWQGQGQRPGQVCAIQDGEPKGEVHDLHAPR